MDHKNFENNAYEHVLECLNVIETLTEKAQDIDNIIEDISKQYNEIIHAMFLLEEEQVIEVEDRLKKVAQIIRQRFNIVWGNDEWELQAKIEQFLHEQWVWHDYQLIARGELPKDQFDQINVNFFSSYLGMLLLDARRNLDSFQKYLQAIINFSQYDPSDENMVVIYDYIDTIVMQMDNIDDVIEDYIDDFGYFGELTWNLNRDEYVQDLADDEGISIVEAEKETEEIQLFLAKSHIFLDHIVHTYMSFFENEGDAYQNEIVHMINDIRDLLDSEMFIPFILHSNRPGEDVMRLKMIRDDFLLH